MERKGVLHPYLGYKGSEYLAEALIEDWQDEYVIYDCCAGSGNLLAGLTNRRNYMRRYRQAECKDNDRETSPTLLQTSSSSTS